MESKPKGILRGLQMGNMKNNQCVVGDGFHDYIIVKVYLGGISAKKSMV